MSTVETEVHAGATPSVYLSHSKFLIALSDHTHIPSNIDERLIAAARDDNQELLLEVFDKGGFDINHKAL